jgi:ribosome-binding ATPase YchF (GTP1/OBG family)
MNRLILLTYLTISVFMSSTWTVTACIKMVDNIQSIYDFLLRHESGEFVEYAELIKNEKNINAKNSHPVT